MYYSNDKNIASFVMMLKHGGDPSIKDAEANNCMKIAVRFSSHAVVRYLHANGVR